MFCPETEQQMKAKGQVESLVVHYLFRHTTITRTNRSSYHIHTLSYITISIDNHYTGHYPYTTITLPYPYTTITLPYLPTISMYYHYTTIILSMIDMRNTANINLTRTCMNFASVTSKTSKTQTGRPSLLPDHYICI